MPLFQKTNGKLENLRNLPLDKERKLQRLIEENLSEVLDLEFLATELEITDGRIDTLAIDSMGAPVIIEYKKNQNENIINQSLFYLSWLKEQKKEFFEMFVNKRLGPERAKNIDWKNPRVICVAESYNKYDLGAAKAMGVKMDLFTFRYYEKDIFSLEKFYGEESQKKIVKINPEKSINIPENKITNNIDAHLIKGLLHIQSLFFLLKERILALDETIEEKATGNYIVYRVSKSFAEIHIQKNKILLYLRPAKYNDPDHLIQQIPDSYNWSLNRRAYISDENTLEYIMKLVEQSYRDVI